MAQSSCEAVAQKGSKDAVVTRFLLEKGANTRWPWQNGTALQRLCVRLLLDKGMDINGNGEIRGTALRRALI